MKHSTSVASLGGALCLLAVGVEAQETQGGGLTLEEITVTARRREENLQSTPVAVTALAFVFGLLLLPLAEETRGKTLPA